MSSPSRAAWWRREPYRLLFPLGAGLAVLAVLPFTCGRAGGGSLALFHSVAQIQGFLTCFVVGFLFTLVPARTRTRPPASWQMAAAYGLPVAAVLSAFLDEPAVASWLWLALLAVVMAFTVRRYRAVPERDRALPVLLWVPVSIAAGAVGAVLVAGGPRLVSGSALELWTIGRGLLVQGFVTGLVFAVGGLLLPQITRGEPPRRSGRRRRSVALHALAALAFFGSFPLEVLWNARLGFAVRAAVAAVVLVASAGVHRVPTLPGLHRRLVWLSAWLVPAAFLVGALAPRFRGAALHVLFVGAFAQITLATSLDVVLSRAARGAALAASPAAVRLMAALLAAAFGARIAATIDLRHVPQWLGIAAVSFCAAVAAWAALVAPVLVAGEHPGDRDEKLARPP